MLAPSCGGKPRQRALRGRDRDKSPHSRLGKGTGGLIGCCLGFGICAFPFSICSGAFDSNLELPISLCRSHSLRQAEVWNSKPEFLVAKAWPPSVERFLQYDWKGLSMSRKVRSLREEGGCRCCLFQNGTLRVSRAFRGRKRETPKLSGNRETRTLMSYPNYSCGLMLDQAASECAARQMGGSSYENKDDSSRSLRPGCSQDC